ncbi:Endonuclease, Uma2 family (restriction endonuclease fold) [Streptomyces pini]|uniref:Endonuclease, Uma2 family (Restriction endonuclease fold) n=2 Tax=Streptomyces pini TaxID=1520580 RepID=A0A1I4IV94_9ACTN|nr:Endonuclease, Uma2 family (restriction endonuclease fold) [Streptomyces pini]
MGAVMSVEPEYAWPRPPAGGYTAEDLDRIPDLPPHTELIDGSLVFVSPQTAFHARAMRLLENHLLQAAPPELDVFRDMTVTLGKRDRPEPDVVVVRADALTRLRQTGFRPEDVVLAVEVVSDDSEARDRETKPRKYAAAGIPHFWRVEAGEGEDGAASPVAYVFELEPATRTYAVTGIHHERLKTDVPFPVDIDLTAVARRV